MTHPIPATPGASGGRRLRNARRLSFTAQWLSFLAMVLLTADAVSAALGYTAGFSFSAHLGRAIRDASGLSMNTSLALANLEGATAAAILFFFFLQLTRIARSVPMGQAFDVVNADRLTRMAAAMVALFLLHLIVNLRISAATVGPHPLWIELLVAGALRVFAEAFREGAAMRDELEGTV